MIYLYNIIILHLCFITSLYIFTNINYASIEILDLEDNKLGDYALILLLASLTANKSVRKLNISKNYATDKICDLLVSVIAASHLTELYLHWNQLKGESGSKIFEALVENDSLLVFDISANSLAIGS